MSKIVRLTESDLTRIVKRVIEESDVYDEDFNEYLNTSKLPDREMKYFSWLSDSKFKTYKEKTYDDKMELLRKDKIRYNLVFDILDYMDEYNKKVGINRNIKITNLNSIINKNLDSLKEIRHKWMKLSENPDIAVEDLFSDFN